MVKPTYTAKEIADRSCRCTRCEEARRLEQLAAVMRAIESFGKPAHAN